MRKAPGSGSSAEKVEELELLGTAELCKVKSRNCRTFFLLAEGGVEDDCIGH